ncbi:twitching motility protein PilT [Comamonadaceae bacterium]|nr:twitching motility protein PilT [Comamonadaceae bacterium]
MPDKVFVDTNIWLYALLEVVDTPADRRHQQAISLLAQLTRPVINSQVIRETCGNLIKKAKMPEASIQGLLLAWYRDSEVVTSNAAQYLLASELRTNNAFSYWDSMIVAAALDAGCTNMFSEDLQHGQKILGQLTIVNPFLA